MERHDLDPVSLTFGFVFAGLGLLFLVGQADEALRLHWMWPLLLLALGVGILLDAIRRRPAPDAPPEASPTDPDPTLTDPDPTLTDPDPTRPDPDPARPDPDPAPDR